MIELIKEAFNLDAVFKLYEEEERKDEGEAPLINEQAMMTLREPRD